MEKERSSHNELLDEELQAMGCSPPAFAQVTNFSGVCSIKSDHGRSQSDRKRESIP